MRPKGGMRFAWPIALWALSLSCSMAATRAPDAVLRDSITDAAYRSYRVLPFEVPAGVEALEIRFDYTGR